MRDEAVKRVSDQYSHVPTLNAWEQLEKEQEMSGKGVFPTVTTSRPLIHPEEKRPLSMREIIRITGIPDSIAPRLRETCTENELIKEYTHVSDAI
jgi:site-specific DNA-cytosine methylase